MKTLVVKFIKFGIVGTVGTVIDFGFTYLFFTILTWDEYVSNTLGFVIAATANYIFNRLWTWRSTNKNVSREYAKFIAVSLIGLAINTAAIFGWLEFVGLGISVAGFTFDEFWVAKVVATLVVMVWNFTANHFYTFRDSGVASA